MGMGVVVVVVAHPIRQISPWLHRSEARARKQLLVEHSHLGRVILNYASGSAEGLTARPLALVA